MSGFDNNWCNALYFPFGREKLGGMYCRLEKGHSGNHWCEHEDEIRHEEENSNHSN